MSRPRPSAPLSPIESSASFQTALSLLFRAHNYAVQLQLDVWDFAVEIAALHHAGIDNSDLRLLTCEGYVAHAEEHTLPGQQRRTFQPIGPLTLTDHTCFVLTEKGISLLGRASDGPTDSTLSPRAPRWDASLRELRLDGQLVKHFKVPAPNQELILSAFEEEGWPTQMDDPLPPQPNQCPKRRLSDAIWCLNRNQKCRLMRFAGSGNGRGLRWGRVS